MKIDKSNIPAEDHELGLKILNKIRSDSRVFGNPAEGMNRLVKQIEENEREVASNKDKNEWNLDNKEQKNEVVKFKNNAKIEKEVSEYLEKIIKNKKEYHDLLVFASLSQNPDEDFENSISFVILCGNKALMLLTRNLPTSMENPLSIRDDSIYSMNGKIYDFNPLKESIFGDLDLIGVDEIEEYVLIVNKNGALIFKNREYLNSPIKMEHISKLNNLIENMIKESGEIKYYLSDLVAISKKQIKKEEMDVKFSNLVKRFGI